MSDEPTQPYLSTPTSLADGRYVLSELLGAGGMGIVLRGRDEILHRDIAVKLLADNLAADTDARERFTREARAAARISDRHVVNVFDVGEEAGRPYLVMEFVDGRSLADVLSGTGPMDPDDLVDVAAQSLSGIARAHAVGLLHRDIKPGNLLRDRAGTVKVTDFGVAEAADAPGITRSGFVLGTRSYLPPERRRGDPATVRSDLWSLGATLLELATGQAPSPGHGAEQLPEETPQELRRLIALLLQEDPDERPFSAEAALDVLAGGGPVGIGRGAITNGTATPDPAAPAAGTTELLEAEAEPALEASAPVPPATPDRSRPTAWGKVAAVATVLLLVAIAFQFAGDDEPEADAEAGVPGVERLEEDPAGTARNLADWIRDRADD